MAQPSQAFCWGRSLESVGRSSWIQSSPARHAARPKSPQREAGQVVDSSSSRSRTRSPETDADAQPLVYQGSALHPLSAVQTKVDCDELPVALEMFCGGARLSEELQRCGFSVIGIDWKANKDHPKVLFMFLFMWFSVSGWFRGGLRPFWDGFGSTFGYLNQHTQKPSNCRTRKFVLKSAGGPH